VADLQGSHSYLINTILCTLLNMFSICCSGNGRLMVLRGREFESSLCFSFSFLSFFLLSFFLFLYSQKAYARIRTVEPEAISMQNSHHSKLQLVSIQENTYIHIMNIWLPPTILGFRVCLEVSFP
jgi:hypothetical protein